MDESEHTEHLTSPWQLKLGLALLVLSIVGPVVGLLVIGSIGLSAAMSASISGVILVGGEVIGIASIAIMGRPGYELIKQRAASILRRHGPPQEVGSLRYRVGLWLFCTPLLIGFAGPYASLLWPEIDQGTIYFAVAGDVLLLVSLFVLGGDFWDKLRGLFIHSAKIAQ